MKIFLVGFSEFISIEDSNSVSRFLIFKDENGRELKTPVSDEAIRAVATFMASGLQKKESPAPVVRTPEPVVEQEPEEGDIPEEESDEFEGAEEFGGDPQFPEVPTSEEDIPSL